MVLILTKHPDADLTPFRSTYLAHLRQRAETYRDLSRRLFGRDIPQVMLLHHNLINALFLDDAIQQLNPDPAFGQDEIGFRPQAAGFRQRIASHWIVLLVMRT